MQSVFRFKIFDAIVRYCWAPKMDAQDAPPGASWELGGVRLGHWYSQDAPHCKIFLLFFLKNDIFFCFSEIARLCALGVLMYTYNYVSLLLLIMKL